MTSALETAAGSSGHFPDAQKGSRYSDVKSSVHYRRQIEMSGWVMKKKHMLRGKRIRRFFRLKNSVLTNHPKMSMPATWNVSVSKCVVKVDISTRSVHLRTVDRQVRFTCETEEEVNQWVLALRSASECNISDFYQLGEQLGVGSFGSVREGFDVHSKQKRAVKIINKSSNTKEDEFQQREIDVILAIKHNNIIRTFDIFDDNDYIYVVMEYIPNGDMFDYLAKWKALPEYEAKHFMYQLLTAVEYLHSQNVVHRDIKAENCLVASAEPLQIKLADFGFSRFIETQTIGSPSSVALKSVVGTCYYIAPEILDGAGHGLPVDIFSSGVLMYRTLNGRLPFRGFTQEECFKLAKQNRANFTTPQWANASPEALDLCRSMLQADPAKRPTAQQALSHPWFVNDEDFTPSSRLGSMTRDHGPSLRSSSGSRSFTRQMTYDDIPEPISSPFG